MRQFPDFTTVCHFTGKLYHILTSSAYDSESQQRFVVYQDMKNAKIWIMPYDKFYGKVDNQKYRFERFGVETP